MQKARNFRGWIVWQKAHQLVLAIYKITSAFPIEERYGLVSQIRRAAVSVAANIAEGFTKKGAKNKLYFYNISEGSLEEVKYYLILSNDLKYLESIDAAWSLAEEVSVILLKYVNTLRENP